MKIDPSIYSLIDRLAAEREGEFDYAELIPAVAAEFRDKHGDELAVEQAKTTIAKRFRALDNPDQGELFSRDAIISLGERRVIRRGLLTVDTALSRRDVIGVNYKAQFDAWRAEDDYLAQRIEWLQQHPGATIDDYESAFGDEEAA